MFAMFARQLAQSCACNALCYAGVRVQASLGKLCFAFGLGPWSKVWSQVWSQAKLGKLWLRDLLNRYEYTGTRRIRLRVYTSPLPICIMASDADLVNDLANEYLDKLERQRQASKVFCCCQACSVPGVPLWERVNIIHRSKAAKHCREEREKRICLHRKEEPTQGSRFGSLRMRSLCSNMKLSKPQQI